MKIFSTLMLFTAPGLCIAISRAQIEMVFKHRTVRTYVRHGHVVEEMLTCAPSQSVYHYNPT